MNKFDRDRVLPAWDGLMSKQQAVLQSLNCPLMYVTNMTADMQVRALIQSFSLRWLMNLFAETTANRSSTRRYSRLNVTASAARMRSPPVA
jgi:hypothetical protein